MINDMNVTLTINSTCLIIQEKQRFQILKIDIYANKILERHIIFLYYINGVACMLITVQGDNGIVECDAGYTKKSL